MTFFRIILILFSLVLTVCNGAESAAPIVTLLSTAQLVRQQNPDLIAARWRLREARGRITQSGRLTNPEIETTFERDPHQQQGYEIGITQRFPLTQRLHLEKAIARADWSACEADIRELERHLIAQAHEQVVKILALRERRSLLQERIRHAAEFAEFLGQSVAVGEASPLDAGQARLEARSLESDMRQLDASEASATGLLKPLLGMTPAQRLLVSGSLAEPQTTTLRSSVTNRPDYQAARHETDSAAQELELERAKKYEDIEAGIFAGQDRNDDTVVALRFKIPLPIWNDNRGAIDSARAKMERKTREAAALERSIELEVESARAEMLSWAELVTEIRDHMLPLAEEQATLAETTFRKGQGEILSVFRCREKFGQLANSRLDALEQYHLAQVRLHSAINKD